MPFFFRVRAWRIGCGVWWYASKVGKGLKFIYTCIMGSITSELVICMGKNMKRKAKDRIFYVFLNIMGCIIYAAGLQCFAAPHKIAPGGASGIAVLVRYLWNIPMGGFVFVFNIPLLAYILWKDYFPKSFVVKTFLSTLLLSVVTDYVVVHFPVYKGDPLLAGIYAGAFMGVGLALVHMGFSNTGGISLLGLIVHKKSPKLQIGTLLSVLNILVVAASGVVYRNPESMLYAMLTVYISGMFMDKMIEHAESKNLMIIISEQPDEVKNMFVQERKGITILKGEGGYTQEKKKVILCASNTEDCENLQRSVKEVDHEALIIVTQASRVIGKGFKHLM